MLDLVIGLAFLALVALIAFKAFKKPSGVYLRSALIAPLPAALVLGIWFLAGSAISGQAGLGYLAITIIATLLGVFVAAVACLAATARHVWNALHARGA